ncbi:PfkB family carbohydrate kinase [Paenibacillus larvae]|uniref:Ribokinase-like protein n=5 Tax=Paenibacillus larvae TaxID=1464 RepID=V9WCB9_9BACL|nr:PfkB family carbohydrate kinase [Paenibacillus larvae]AHD07355.1 ribokinase-like protein [Paenibacillus larvae subsp. larvae DSM 25430]AQR79175.1 hypothetical protein BXP28_20045 [Paenibacillus larvae subsp. larvae]AVF23695.1 ribokinase-like protein [Paenibacillus larvae subsp. larvae]AVF24893.1 ribokinase-like protein [Paenibacillus larvae subsp. larvae]AVF29656.1 ribokinase-like protein [Paenibacillus larvae subsp. larvae]
MAISGKISVIGSLNMDLVQQVRNFPKPGETTPAMKTSYCPGGKGANQAVAVSLSGTVVNMLGAVGSDAFGEKLVNQHQMICQYCRQPVK